MSEGLKKYDLEERTEKFGESVIDLCRACKKDVVSEPIIKQLIRSSTSIGANYFEANGASSKRDFRNKIAICRKEAQETRHWLRMIGRCCTDKLEAIRPLSDECRQLVMIFAKIQKSTDLSH